LALVSPADGTILPPADVPSRPDPEGALPEWSGTPYDPENANCFLQANSILCQIGDPRAMEAQLIIDQDDIEFIQEGQSVDIKLDELPADVLSGTIDRISPVDLQEPPKNLSNKAGGELATKTDAAGVERPLSPSYQVRIPLDDEEGMLRIGLRGRAKVYATSRTLAQRLWRFVSRTFNFYM
jgi:hypothetical protein